MNKLLETIENPALYEQYIKAECVMCSKPIPKTWSWYKLHGNYCSPCLAKCKPDKLTTKAFRKALKP